MAKLDACIFVAGKFCCDWNTVPLESCLYELVKVASAQCERCLSVLTKLTVPEQSLARKISHSRYQVVRKRRPASILYFFGPDVIDHLDKCRFVEIALFANKSGQRKTEQTSDTKDMDTILLRVVVDDVGSPFNRRSNGCQSMNNNTTFNMSTCPRIYSIIWRQPQRLFDLKGRLLGEANVDQRLAAGVAYTNPLWGRVSVGVDSLKQAAYPMICTNGSLFHN
ncbi:hypothetical protein T07_12596 [Trichinella nelsoni]|uniref:Uncharacterized protein n=1 Tax=Trichinella nelsoni TaxID=6336 RepID=A0A0V0SCC1_9BILA|nr:hypothetical protein T07_12596 [Trichinella nelsoni]